MYIEEELWDWIERRCLRACEELTHKLLEDIMDSCGVWYSLDGVRAETEDFEMSLEEACKEYWFLIEGNKILFVNAEEFAEDLDEYLGL